MPTTVTRSVWKPKIEFQYGGRLLSETGSSNISAVDFETSGKCHAPIAFYREKCEAAPHRKSEVDLRRYSRHLEKMIWHYNFIGNHPTWTQSGGPMQNRMPKVAKMSKSKTGVELQYGGRLLSETGSSNISAVDWDICSATTAASYCSADAGD